MPCGAWQKTTPAGQPCVPGEGRQRTSSISVGIVANGVTGAPVGPLTEKRPSVSVA